MQKPQGRVCVAVALHEPAQAGEPGGQLAGEVFREVLPGGEPVRAVLGPCVGVLQGEPGEAGEDNDGEVRGDEGAAR